MRRDLVRYFVIVFEKGCDVRVEKMINSQPSPAYCHVNHIFFYYKGLLQGSFGKIINSFFTSHSIPSSYFNNSMVWDWMLDGMRLNARVKGLDALCEGMS